MISKIYIDNFRSLRNASLPLGKINILTGANNSGKSSVLYGLLSLRNFLLNPNQSLDAVFTLPFLNLGGFENIVSNKNKDSEIKIGIEFKNNETLIEYQIKFGLDKSIIEIRQEKDLVGKIEITLPYALNKQSNLIIQGFNYSYSWNGLQLKDTTDLSKVGDDLNKSWFKSLEKSISKPSQFASESDFIPIRRGFSTPFFGQVPLNGQITTESEIATLISIEKQLAVDISYHLEKIANRSFRVEMTPQTANFYLKTTDITTGQTIDIVNEGHGTNQLVTILAKTLRKQTKFVCIDEPETHLHPSMIAKMVDSFVEIAQKNDKQFLISTHSEHLVQTLMTAVAAGKILPEDVAVFYLKKEGDSTEIEFQPINRHGQIKGGLKNFYESELENLKTLFKITV
jgi:predicted ATPase